MGLSARGGSDGFTVLMCNYGEDHVAGERCIYEHEHGSPRLYYLFVPYSTGGGSNGGPGIDPIENPIDTGSGGGTSIPLPPDSDNPITSPTLPNGTIDYSIENTRKLIEKLKITDTNQLIWLNANKFTAANIYFFLEKNNNLEGEKFAKNALQVLMINPNANPFLGSDCRSFEYAQPPGALQKGCAVTNFNHTFYTAGISSDGSPYYGEIESIVDIAYFTMPVGMTNGRAANLTAIAVTTAIKATDLYYAENPRISKFTLGEYFKNRINHYLLLGVVLTLLPLFLISQVQHLTLLVF